MEKGSEPYIGKNVVAGVSWSYAERFLAQIISLVVSVVLARILDPEHYGILSIVSVFIVICDSLVTGGFGNALVQKKNADSTDFNSICWVSMALAVCLYGLLFVCAPVIATFYEIDGFTTITRVLGIRILFSAFNSIQLAYVQKNLLFKKNFIVSLTGAAVSAVIGIGGALAGMGVWALVAQNLSITVVNTVVLFLLIDWKPGLRCSWESVRSMWSYGYKILLSTITFTLKDNIRSLVVGKYFSPESLAYYNEGNKYPSLLVVDIVNSIGKVLFPVLSNHQDDLKGNKQLMRLSIQLSSFILMPLILGLLAVSDTFVICLLTDKWLKVASYMRILCLVYLTRPMSTMFQKALLSIGKSNINLAHELITSILSLGMIVLAVVYKDIYLIAWSYVLVAVIGTSFFAAFVRLCYQYRFREILEDYLPALLLSTVMCIGVYVCGFLQINAFVKLIVQIAVGAIIYIGGAFLFRMKAMFYILDFVGGRRKKRYN